MGESKRPLVTWIRLPSTQLMHTRLLALKPRATFTRGAPSTRSRPPQAYGRPRVTHIPFTVAEVTRAHNAAWQLLQKLDKIIPAIGRVSPLY